MLPSARMQMEREGMDPNREIPVGTHHPQAANDAHSAQIEDLKRSIESRFASVVTPSNFLQAGLYNTLGNNPVTQLLGAGAGAVGDVWDSLMNGPDDKKRDEKAKDPLTALNTHTKILHDILGVLDSINDYIHFRDSSRPDPKKDKPGPRSGKHVKQDDGPELKKNHKEPDYRSPEEKKAAQAKKEKAHAENKKTLDGLKKTRDDLSEKLKTAPPEEKEKLEKQLKATNAAIEPMERIVAKGPEHATPKADDPKKIKLDKQIKGTEAAIEAMERRAAETGSEEHKQMVQDLKASRDKLVAKRKQYEPEEATEAKGDAPEATESSKPKREDGKGFLSKMMDKLGFSKASSVLENFTKTMQKASGELSKSFKDVEKATKRKSKPLADAIKGSESAKFLKLGKNALAEKSKPLIKALKGSETAKYLGMAKDKSKDIAKGIAAKATGLVSSMAVGKSMADPNVVQPPAAPPPPPPPTKEPEDPPEAMQAAPGPEGTTSSALETAVDAAETGAAIKTGWETLKKGGSALKTGAGKAAGKAAGWIGKGATAAKTLAESPVGKFAGKAAAVIGAGTASYNAISEEANGKHVESIGDVVPDGWDKLNPFEWASRGARYAGNKLNKGYEAVSGQSIGSDIYDAFHKDPMKQMAEKDSQKAKLARPEPGDTERFKKDQYERPPEPSRAEALSQSKQQLDEEAKKPAATGGDTVIGAVNNTTNKNTTVLPSRTSVSNTDSTFNRYVGRTYGM